MEYLSPLFPSPLSSSSILFLSTCTTIHDLQSSKTTFKTPKHASPSRLPNMHTVLLSNSLDNQALMHPWPAPSPLLRLNRGGGAGGSTIIHIGNVGNGSTVIATPAAAAAAAAPALGR
ncbi:hypothetical protein BJ166DRAFT_620473 [Pestalotiopsis sp. NC0098]|nr:hypothetical protein BJ166DRAFT_620473 [Pestalotiopsis sp. NC0098]